jgi:transposase
LLQEYIIMYEILTQILNIPNYEVVGFETKDEQIIFDIQSIMEGAKCPRCKTYSSDLHENHPRIVRDLPISGKACYLRFTRRRFFCPKCRNPFSEPLSFVKEQRDYTNRYQARIFHQVKENNITAVMRLECITYDQVESIFLTEAKSYIPANPFTSLKRLGIDEISLRKGKQDFVLILSNLDTGEIVDVIEKRTKEKLRQRFEQLTSDERNQITEVAIDMWEPYADVCRELLPNVTITVDRFHVSKAINTELKNLKNKEKKQHPEVLKGSHYALLKNQDNLTDKQQERLQKVYDTCPTLKMGHRLKECLRHIFESHSTKEKANQRIQKWLIISESHGLFPDFRKTLLSWLDNITNYFRQRTTSGIVEGINNKVKLIKRRAFGFRNFEHFRLRVIVAFL